MVLMISCFDRYLDIAQSCHPRNKFTELRDLFWRAISYKDTTRGRNRVLLTSSMGEATFMALLRGVVHNVKHHHTLDITVDSLLAVKSSHVESIIGRRGTGFDVVVHVVSDPLKAICAISRSDSALSLFIPVQSTLPPLTKALYYWISTNQIIDFYADVNLPVASFAETIAKQPLLSFLRRAHTEKCKSMGELEKRMPGTTWKDLSSADSFAAQAACKMALHYGYDCPLKIESED